MQVQVKMHADYSPFPATGGRCPVTSLAGRQPRGVPRQACEPETFLQQLIRHAEGRSSGARLRLVGETTSFACAAADCNIIYVNVNYIPGVISECNLLELESAIPLAFELQEATVLWSRLPSLLEAHTLCLWMYIPYLYLYIFLHISSAPLRR
jgi:hypothetical protein